MPRSFRSSSHLLNDKPKKNTSLDDWVIDVTENASLIALALPELEPAAPEVRTEASEVSRTIFDDISFASAYQGLNESPQWSPSVHAAAPLRGVTQLL